MGGGAWQKNLPPGLELTDLSTVSYAGRGIWLHRGTDQYGRTWEYTEHRDGSRSIHYTDEGGLRHELTSAGYGQWHDSYLDEHGNRQITIVDKNGPPPDLPPGLVRGNHHTYTDDSGNVHHRATDQYGREWDWYQDKNTGTRYSGYTDDDGQWHEIRGPINGLWFDRSWDENGEVRNTVFSPPRDPNEAAVHAFLNDPDMTAEGEPTPGEPGPILDPDLFDPNTPGPTLDPALLDPSAPGPTLDPNLLDPSAPVETIDPALLDPSAPGPTIDPAQLEQGVVQPGGVAEPTDVTADQGFTEPALTQALSTPGQDHLDDPLSL